MRIIGGKFKGRRLYAPRGAAIRPTADRVRESVFNILAGNFRDGRVIDLFAGTGALGLEALSRGADSAIFVDHRRAAVEVVRRNIAACGCQEQAKIFMHDIRPNLNCLKSAGQSADIVFMDPPYRQDLIGPALRHLHAGQFVTAGASVIIEHARDEILPNFDAVFRLADQRRYGKTLVSFLNYML